MNRQDQLLGAVFVLVLIAFAFVAMSVPSAQDEGTYPSRPIKVIVPNGVGGSTDVTSRLVASAIANNLDAQMAIVNKGGGATSLGAIEAATSKGDGYTLLSTHEAFLTSSAMGVYTPGPESMVPVAQIAKEVIVLAVRKGASIENLNQFYARAAMNEAGAKLKLGINPGAANHFFFLNGLSPVEHDVSFVPTGGGSKTMKALLGGSIDAGMFEVSAAKQLIESGDIIPIAVFDTVRHPALPEVPTATEQGHAVNVGLHYVWYVPIGTPSDRIDKLVSSISAVINDSEFNQSLYERAITPAFLSGDELSAALSERYSNILAQKNKYVIARK